VLVSLVYFTVYAWFLSGQTSVMDGSTFEFGNVFKKLVIFYFHVTLVIYWAIVLAHLSWGYYQRSRERELQASALATELVRTRLRCCVQLNPTLFHAAYHLRRSENPRTPIESWRR
jgi:hypothetical protein